MYAHTQQQQQLQQQKQEQKQEQVEQKQEQKQEHYSPSPNHHPVLEGDENDVVQVIVDEPPYHNHHHHEQLLEDEQHQHQHQQCFDDAILTFEDADSVDGAIYGGGDYGVQRVTAGDVANQLTLSFKGQCYIFDYVTPDKVQAVLLLLGGNAISPALQGAEVQQMSQPGNMEYVGRCSQPQREASLNRFRQKRKERCFDKKIRYNVRQEVALRMQRKKGQFTSSSSKNGDESSGGNAQDSGPEESDTSCAHCGISSKSTPMMRRGPNGPRTLCNACGLVWANKGTLRDLSKKQDPLLMSSELTNESPFRATDILVEPKSVDFGEGDKTALIAQH